MTLSDIVIFLIGLLGFCSVFYGLWQLSQPIAFIVSGALLVLWSLFISKAKAKASEPLMTGGDN